MPIPTRQLVMSAVLGTALAATPAYAGEDKEKAKPIDAAEVKKQLDDIKADVKQILDLQKDLAGAVFGKTDGKPDSGLVKRLGDLAALIGKLDERLTAMEKKMDGTTTRTSERPPAGTSRAFVRIVNDYPVDMTMLVNGRSTRLLPGEVKTVEVPSGSYTYELLASGQMATTSTLKDGETVTLRIK
jgi:hypothetical protein